MQCNNAIEQLLSTPTWLYLGHKFCYIDSSVIAPPCDERQWEEIFYYKTKYPYLPVATALDVIKATAVDYESIFEKTYGNRHRLHYSDWEDWAKLAKAVNKEILFIVKQGAGGEPDITHYANYYPDGTYELTKRAKIAIKAFQQFKKANA